jgi:hypothetical protein
MSCPVRYNMGCSTSTEIVIGSRNWIWSQALAQIVQPKNYNALFYVPDVCTYANNCGVSNPTLF